MGAAEEEEVMTYRVIQEAVHAFVCDRCSKEHRVEHATQSDEPPEGWATMTFVRARSDRPAARPTKHERAVRKQLLAAEFSAETRESVASEEMRHHLQTCDEVLYRHARVLMGVEEGRVPRLGWQL